MTSPLNCPSRLRAVSGAVLAAAFVMAQPAQGAERAAQAKPSGKKVASAAAGNAAALNALTQQIEAMRLQYEARLKVLEDKLDATLPGHRSADASAALATPKGSTPAPALPSSSEPAAPTAMPAAAALTSVSAQIATPEPATSSQANANSFNPAVSLILSGTYASLQRDPGSWQLSGFVPSGGEVGPGARSFSLGESELGLSANIDPWLYGALTLSVSAEDTISAEEAFIQTTALPGGLKIKAGRFFAGLGYLNEQHAHTWDFVDAPLAYQAFLGGQYKQEGVQARWLLPTDQFIELTGELGNGASFPGNDRTRNGAGSVLLAAHTGGDVGDSHSWRAGASWLQTQAKDRSWDTTDSAGNSVTNAFTGSSRLWVLDGVWKWAPNGNATRTNLKLQGEYFRRVESGDVTYALADLSNAGLSANTDAYRSAQSGWYLQGVYQFMPGWRVGLRHDRLSSGTVDLHSNAANIVSTDYNPQRNSLMLDWSPSEFSRWRIQLSHDQAREGLSDRQLFLQYQMSLGAHGAHSY
jgi:hypothetical protein